MEKHIHSAHGQRFPGIRRIGQLILAGSVAAFFAACGSAQQRGGAASSAPAEAAATTTEATVTDGYRIDSLLTLRGRVVLAHEVRAFIPEGDTVEYWIVDRSGALERAYDRATGGQKNGKPAWAELKVRYKGPSDEGFAAEYAGVFEVEEVLSVEKTEE